MSSLEFLILQANPVLDGLAPAAIRILVGCWKDASRAAARQQGSPPLSITSRNNMIT